MPTEVQSPVLTGEEVDLLTELLNREARNLPLEIRHTDKRATKEALHRRLTACEALLAKFTPAKEA